MNAQPPRPILVTGASGQLGRALTSLRNPHTEILPLDRDRLNVEHRGQVAEVFAQVRPSAVINAAAYTAVDKAESEPEKARAVNVTGARNVAEAAVLVGARVVHVSTDYVFDGRSSIPYKPDAEVNPLGVYGATKLAGERELLAAAPDAIVVRTAWLYAAWGKNFLNTILNLIRAGRELSIVADQVSTPTSAADLARVLVRCALDPSIRGVAHWTNAGTASWYHFAVAIQELALERSLVPDRVPIKPTTTAEFRKGKSTTDRPAYSVLDSSFLWQRYGRPADWRAALGKVLDGMSPPPGNAA